MRTKHPNDSKVETRFLIMPRDANPLGNMFGGLLMSRLDETASMVAVRHSGRPAVTVAIDSVSIIEPIKVGDQMVMRAKLTYVGRTSMEVAVVVRCENPVNETSAIATTAYLTFVAVDDNGKPCEVPSIRCDTEHEKESLEKARVRVENRKKHRTRYDFFDEF